MLELDQRFADEALSDAEFLRQLGFDDLLSTLHAAGEYRFPHEGNDARFLGYLFETFKGRHSRREFTLAISQRQLIIRRKQYTMIDQSIIDCNSRERPLYSAPERKPIIPRIL